MNIYLIAIIIILIYIADRIYKIWDQGRDMKSDSVHILNSIHEVENVLENIEHILEFDPKREIEKELNLQQERKEVESSEKDKVRILHEHINEIKKKISFRKDKIRDIDHVLDSRVLLDEEKKELISRSDRFKQELKDYTKELSDFEKELKNKN